MGALSVGTATVVAVSLAGITPDTGRGQHPGAAAAVRWTHDLRHVATGDRDRRPPSPRRCQRWFGARCYGPRTLAAAYDVRPLWRKGIDGSGRTIVIADPFGSPTLRHDLHVFDRAFGLPDPRLRIQQPAGKVPPYDPHRRDAVGWAVETTLDVDYAHALAPHAAIRLIETPTDEVEGTSGMAPIMRAEAWAVHHGSADVISQSFGATEQTFPSERKLRSLRFAFIAAARHGVTVLAASGDSGATDYRSDARTLYHHRVQSWPSTDPLVTSVGGLALKLTKTGRRRAPDRVWNDGEGAGGGGRSVFFDRPGWQQQVHNRVGTARGVPDVSMDAAVRGGGLIWTTFRGEPKGWQLVGGTSMATPLFAGVVALAAEAGHRDLGPLGPPLYAMGDQDSTARAAEGLVDVTRGNNSHAGVTGWRAVPGFDLASGWGTVDAARFVPALAAVARH